MEWLAHTFTCRSGGSFFGAVVDFLRRGSGHEEAMRLQRGYSGEKREWPAGAVTTGRGTRKRAKPPEPAWRIREAVRNPNQS